MASKTLVLAASLVALFAAAPAASPLPDAGPPVCAGASLFLVQEGVDACTHTTCMPDHPALGQVLLLGVEASATVTISCGREALTTCTASTRGAPAPVATCVLPPVPQTEGPYITTVDTSGPVLFLEIFRN